MSDLRPLDTELRKERFKQTILPLLRANEDIARQQSCHSGIEAEDNDLLRSFAQRYRTASLIEKKAGQMMLAESRPVSIEAQACIESGWGQSRFALKETPFWSVGLE